MEGHIRETAEDLLPAIPEVIAAEPSRRTAA
jgi:hypothetical protein